MTVGDSSNSTNTTLDTLRDILRDILDVMLTWFRDNHMQANPDKFNLMVFDRNNATHTATDTVITSVQETRILGVMVGRPFF